MKKVTHLNIAPIAALVLLVLLALLVAKRKDLTADEAEGDAVRRVVMLEDTVIRDGDAAVAFLALMTLFVFVIWTALRVSGREDKAMPPAGEVGAEDFPHKSQKTRSWRRKLRAPRYGPGLGGRDEREYRNLRCACGYERNPVRRNERQHRFDKTVPGDSRCARGPWPKRPSLFSWPGSWRRPVAMRSTHRQWRLPHLSCW